MHYDYKGRESREILPWGHNDNCNTIVEEPRDCTDILHRQETSVFPSRKWNLGKRETWNRIRLAGEEEWLFVELGVSLVEIEELLGNLGVSLIDLTVSFPVSTVSSNCEGVTAIVCTFAREIGDGQIREENRGMACSANTSTVVAFPWFWRQERKSSEGIEPGCVSQQISFT